MRAIVITGHGGPEQAHLADIPREDPGAGEVQVRIEAAALNHLDLWMCQGRPGLNLSFPHVLGSDAAGVVEAVGPGVSSWKPGDEVVINAAFYTPDSELVAGIQGAHRPGLYAEYRNVPAASLGPKPSHLSWRAAAALSLAHLTAWRMIFSRAQVMPGETVLVHGIGGGVALAALQFLKIAGARTIVTSSSEEKLDAAKRLGADVAINYRQNDDVAKAILDSAGPVDAVIDAVGAATWPINMAATRAGGRIVHCGVTSGAEVNANLSVLYTKQLSVMGSTMGSAAEHREMLRAVSASGLVPVLDQHYPLAEAAAALAHMAGGAQFGKITLGVSDAGSDR